MMIETNHKLFITGTVLTMGGCSKKNLLPCLHFTAIVFLAWSSILAHANFWDYIGLVANQTYQLEFITRIEAPTTYWAVMSCNNGGYGGIQVASPSEHVGLFSIWDTGSNDTFVIGYNKALPFRNYSFRFSGEGTGAQLGFNWAWVKDKPYRMAWRRFVEADQANVRYEGWYYDPYNTNSLGWVWVGTIRHPTADPDAQNMTRPSGFAEVFGSNFDEPREIDIRNVWLLDITNAWKNITAATMTYPVDEAQFWAIPGGWRNHNNDTNYSFSRAPNLPMLPAQDLSPICIPYRLSSGWWSADVSLDAQVGESLGRAFEPDAFWYGGSATNAWTNTIETAGATNAAPKSLYHWRREGDSFGYRLFGLQPNSPNLLRLHFVETAFDAPGHRLQDVVVNGVTVDANLDILALAGAKDQALVRDYVVGVGQNSLIDVSFHSRIPGVPAVVSGVEAMPLLPQLAWHPQPCTNIVGAVAQLSVTANSTSELSYQCQKGDVPLSGETNSYLTIFGLATNDAGNYTVVVSNGYGSVTSAPAMLTVRARGSSPPVFSRNPLLKPPAIPRTEYRGSLRGDAADETGQALTFATISGAHWLSLGADGTIVGTPASSDLGTNDFVVRAINSSGLYAEAVMRIVVGTNNGPLLWLQLKEGNGLLAGDSSKNANTGHILRATWTNGMTGNGLHFSIGDQVVVPDAPSLNPTSSITLSAWINVDSWDGDNRRIFQKGSSDNQYRFLCEYGELKFHLYNVGTLTTALPSTGVWHHVAASYDGMFMDIWMDGWCLARKAATGIIATTTDPLYIATKSGGDGFFRGTICDIRLYGRALVDDEIRALYQADTVGDGIPNVWRQSMFGSGPVTNTLSCASCDADGDGMRNIDEYLAGTDPRNAASALKITSIRRLGVGMRITWSVVSNKRYVMQKAYSATNSAFSGQFQDLTSITIPALPHSVSEATYTVLDSVSTNSAQYYRVKLCP